MRLLAFIACREAQLQTTGKCFPALEIREMCEQDMTDPTSHIVETLCTVPGLAILTLSQAQQLTSSMRFDVVRRRIQRRDAEYSCAEGKQSINKQEAKGILGTGGMNIGMRKSH